MVFLEENRMSNPSFNVATFDIETTALDAVGAGVILCAVIKPLGRAAKVLRYDDMHLSPGNDKLLNCANTTCWWVTISNALT